MLKNSTLSQVAYIAGKERKVEGKKLNQKDLNIEGYLREVPWTSHQGSPQKLIVIFQVLVQKWEEIIQVGNTPLLKKPMAYTDTETPGY